MKVIPPFILPRSCDPGLPPVNESEQKIFDFLLDINVSSHDIAIHSLNMTRHAERRWSEMDFLLVSLRGILVLEVKGGTVSCTDGIWEYSNKTTRASPATQAKENYFTLLKQYLEPRLSKNKLDKLVTGFSCVFTDTARLVGIDESALCEQGDEITCYEREAATAESLKGFVNRVFDHWAGKKANRCRDLTAGEVDSIVGFLRPNFERAPSLNSCLRAAKDKFQKLTEEQYGNMDMLQGLQRFMLEGGAGTGKSFLAMYASRGYAAQGKKTLFLTKNPSFASYASADLSAAGVDVRSLAQLADEVSSAAGKYDVLVMDEAQDLCTWDAIAILDQVVDGGLENGKWAWFGDSNRQVSPSIVFDQEVYEYFRSSANHVPPALKKNVRNTPQVVQAIKHLSGGDIGIAPDHGIGRELVVGQGEGITGALATAREWLQDLVEKDLDISEVVLLAPTTDDLPLAEKIAKNIGIKYAVVDRPDFDYHQNVERALVATVEAYKGLERPIVMLVGFWVIEDLDVLRSLFYKAISRANHTVYIAAESKLREDIQHLIASSIVAEGAST